MERKWGEGGQMEGGAETGGRERLQGGKRAKKQCEIKDGVTFDVML